MVHPTPFRKIKHFFELLFCCEFFPYYPITSAATTGCALHIGPQFNIGQTDLLKLIVKLWL